MTLKGSIQLVIVSIVLKIGISALWLILDTSNTEFMELFRLLSISGNLIDIFFLIALLLFFLAIRKTLQQNER